MASLIASVIVAWLMTPGALVPPARQDVPPGPSAAARCGRLSTEGRMIVCQDGGWFRWRGVTGFRLVHQVATGDEAGARQYLDWASRTGFTVIRVLSTADILFDLPPEAGREALPRAVALAGEYGLYVEVVAIVDSAIREYDWRRHAREVAERCAGLVNCVYEFANEPGHGVQHERLHDMDTVQALAAEAVEGLDLIWTAGPAWESDEDLVPAGRFVVRHLERGGEPWQMVSRVRVFEALGRRLGRPVVSNEPIGFDEVDGRLTGRQRLDDCDIALAMGVLARIFEIGTTFHLEAGLQNEMPGRVQSECAEAFVHGATLVPDGWRLRFYDSGQAESPVASADDDEVFRVYSGVSGGGGLTIALGRTGDPGIVWNEFRPTALLVDRPGVQVWSVRRARGPNGGSPWESNPPFPPKAGSDRF